MPVPGCVKGISDTSNNLDNIESITASLCLFCDHITGSLPTAWADLSLPVQVSYVISTSLSFRTSYWQISPLPTNEVSGLPRGMMGNVILPWIDSQKTVRAHPSLCTYSTLALTLSWYLANGSYITGHVCGFQTSMSADVDYKPGKTTTLGFNTGLALKLQAAHNSTLTRFFLCSHDKVEWITAIPVCEQGGDPKKSCLWLFKHGFKKNKQSTTIKKKKNRHIWRPL